MAGSDDYDRANPCIMRGNSPASPSTNETEGAQAIQPNRIQPTEANIRPTLAKV
jgi:hypothetical protein